MRPRPQRHLVSEITSSILKVNRFESERFYELKYMYSYVIEIYHIIYILFISLNCMLLKQLPVVIHALHVSITIFDLWTKNDLIYIAKGRYYVQLLRKLVAIHSILPCISFYFWCMTFHTLHEYLWDNWSRIIIINNIYFLFKFDLVKKTKRQNTKNTKNKKEKNQQKSKYNNNNKNKQTSKI